MSGRSRWLVLLVAALWLPLAARAIDPVEIPDPALQARYVDLIHELRCMQCQNEAISDSPVSLAGDLRREVREMLVAGKTDQEIRDFMVARYGEFILFRPKFSAKNAWLWFAPLALLLAGLLVGWRVIRSRRGLLDTDLDPVEDEAPRS